ncbi:MAG: hypothetical protein M3Q30_28340 [Actinomycetota bacterium]|nr:hypothetical protein [Actinomycetota bacterium]
MERRPSSPLLPSSLRALRQVVDLEHFRLVPKRDPNIGQHRHEAFPNASNCSRKSQISLSRKLPSGAKALDLPAMSSTAPLASSLAAMNKKAMIVHRREDRREVGPIGYRRRYRAGQAAPAGPLLAALSQRLPRSGVAVEPVGSR